MDHHFRWVCFSSSLITCKFYRSTLNLMKSRKYRTCTLENSNCSLKPALGQYFEIYHFPHYHSLCILLLSSTRSGLLQTRGRNSRSLVSTRTVTSSGSTSWREWTGFFLTGITGEESELFPCSCMIVFYQMFVPGGGLLPSPAWSSSSRWWERASRPLT